MTLGFDTSPGGGMVRGTGLADAQRQIEELRAAWSRQTTPQITPGFIKSGPMEYSTDTREGMIFLTTMLDCLMLGYTVETVVGARGHTEKWVITFHDPETMREIAQ